MPPSPHRLARLAGMMLAALISFLPVTLTAQLQDPPDPLAPGTVRLGVAGIFRTFSGRLTSGGPFADDLASPESLTLLGGAADLEAGIETLLDGGDFNLISGSTRGAVRVTQTRVPVSLEVGVLDRLQLRGTLPFVRSRLEAEVGFLPSADRNLGQSPVYDDLAVIQTFVSEVRAATQGFTADGRDWEPWGVAWASAYSASPLFPTGDSELAAGLLAELDALNAALVADGRAPVSSTPTFAAAPLTGEDFGTLLGSAPFALSPFSQAPYVWELGDAEAEARFELIRGPEGLAVTVKGGVRLPTGTQGNPDLPFSVDSDPGALAFWGGGEAWWRSGALLLGGGFQATLHGESEVVRRIAPIGVAFPASSNRTLLGWTPGRVITGDLLTEWTPSGALRIALGYRLESRSRDSYERRSPVPSIQPGLFPSGDFFSDPSILEEGTAGERHWVHGGMRWLPTQGQGFEIRFDLASVVAGAGSRLLDETNVRIGVRRAIQIW